MRPNFTNKEDACCVCGKLYATPGVGKELEPAWNEQVKELGVWAPNPGDPPQWICFDCHVKLTADAQRS